METTKERVLTIAPELIYYINGQTQKTRVYINSTSDNILTVDDKEYIYEVQDGDTVTEVIEGLIELVTNDEEAIIGVVNDTNTYFDIRGLYTLPFVVTTPTVTETLQDSIPDSLWEIISEDVELLVNENTFANTDMIERGQRYLMAHLISMAKKGLGNIVGVTSENVGDISVSYADPLSEEGLSLSGYGLIYKGIYLKNRRIGIIPASLKNYNTYGG
jgi:hypothetical protein